MLFYNRRSPSPEGKGRFVREEPVFMITIISPAKNMKLHPEGTPPVSVPAFLAEARTIHEVLRTYSPSDLQSLMRINEKLSTDSFERIALMQFDQTGTSAVEN